jgi:hypothetical protein
MYDVDGELYELPPCVDRLIRGEPRPVLLVPRGPCPDARSIIAQPSRGDCQPCLRPAPAAWRAETHAIGLGDREAGTPAEAILGAAKALRPGMIVMGAYGHRGIQEIFGSCTREVLNACATPLFLHH